jgi:hypothetical protein
MNDQMSRNVTPCHFITMLWNDSTQRVYMPVDRAREPDLNQTKDKTMTRTERQEKRDARRLQREDEREQKRKHTIKNVSVLDAYHAKPQFLSGYDEDGHRRVCNPDHAWFILVTLSDGTRWFSVVDAPFETYFSTDMRELETGGRRFNYETGKSSTELEPLFQAGPSHVMWTEGLIAKTRMEERANSLPRVLDPDPTVWGRWPYSEYGSVEWAEEMRDVEMRERHGLKGGE